MVVTTSPAFSGPGCSKNVAHFLFNLMQLVKCLIKKGYTPKDSSLFEKFIKYIGSIYAIKVPAKNWYRVH